MIALSKAVIVEEVALLRLSCTKNTTSPNVIMISHGTQPSRSITAKAFTVGQQPQHHPTYLHISISLAELIVHIKYRLRFRRFSSANRNMNILLFYVFGRFNSVTF